MDDRIYALDKGRTFESVKYKELMAKDGAFTKLAKRRLT